MGVDDLRVDIPEHRTQHLADHQPAARDTKREYANSGRAELFGQGGRTAHVDDRYLEAGPGQPRGQIGKNPLGAAGAQVINHMSNLYRSVSHCYLGAVIRGCLPSIMPISSTGLDATSILLLNLIAPETIASS